MDIHVKWSTSNYNLSFGLLLQTCWASSSFYHLLKSTYVLFWDSSFEDSKLQNTNNLVSATTKKIYKLHLLSSFTIDLTFFASSSNGFVLSLLVTVAVAAVLILPLMESNTTINSFSVIVMLSIKTIRKNKPTFVKETFTCMLFCLCLSSNLRKGKNTYFQNYCNWVVYKSWVFSETSLLEPLK